MMHQLIILASLLLSVVAADCSVQELSEMQVNYNNCSVAGMEETDPCTMLELVINECGEHWTQCHSASEVRRMRDLHIMTLVSRSEEDSVYEECEVVREVRESGRSVSVNDDVVDLCDQDQLSQAQTMFQNCSHATSSSVYSLYHSYDELEDINMISDQICQALNTIDSRCSQHLKNCYDEADLQRTKDNHLDQLKQYLVGLFAEKVNMTVVNNCDDLQDFYDYGYDVSEEEDNISTTETLTLTEIILSTVTERVLSGADNTEEDSEQHDNHSEVEVERFLEEWVKTDEVISEVAEISSESEEARDSVAGSEEDAAAEYVNNATNAVNNDLEVNIAEDIITGELERRTRNSSSSALIGNNYTTYLITTLVLFIM